MRIKHLVVGALFATGIAVTAAAGYAWNEYLRVPPTKLQPLSAELVSLHSPTGQRLLAQSRAAADYDDLISNFVPQSRKAYCSVASALTTLNAAKVSPAPLDQRSLFEGATVDVHPLKVSFIGMSLRELGEVLQAHGARATIIPASTTDIEAFRREARANLQREGDFVLINYERKHLGQQQMGHISPVAAYHEASDRLLILDVAAHKYPPVWVKLDRVWAAMKAPLSPEMPVTRGFILVERPPQAASFASVPLSPATVAVGHR